MAGIIGTANCSWGDILPGGHCLQEPSQGLEKLAQQAEMTRVFQRDRFEPVFLKSQERCMRISHQGTLKEELTCLNPSPSALNATTKSGLRRISARSRRRNRRTRKRSDGVRT